jgi:hypothetical protein
MGFNETPSIERRGLRFSSRRRRPDRAVTETTNGPEDHEAPSSPLAATGEALASLYVTVARAVLLGVEAVEDWRAVSRAPIVTKVAAPSSRAVLPDEPPKPQPARALKIKSEER